MPAAYNKADRSVAPSLIYGVAGIADALGLSRATIYRMIARDPTMPIVRQSERKLFTTREALTLWFTHRAMLPCYQHSGALTEIVAQVDRMTVRTSD